MDRNNTFIPYNAKLSNEEVKALFSSNDSKPFNVISINDYNNILKSFTEKDEKEKDFKRRAQEVIFEIYIYIYIKIKILNIRIN